MYSIEVVANGMERVLRFWFNNFSSMQDCKDYMLTGHWYVYQSWINHAFYGAHVTYECISTTI